MRVLVLYGSTRGGTAGLAHMVADAFVRHHIRADVRRAGPTRDLDEYDAVVVGGALYSNRWHPDAVSFVSRHRAELRTMPVWFFSSGPLDDSARSGALAPVPQVNALAREVEIRGHMTFGGLLDKKPSGLMGLFAYGAEGDFRDRHHVTEWVERIADELSPQASMMRVLDSEGEPIPPKPARRPPVVVVPHRRDPEDVPTVESQFSEDEVVDLTTDVRIEWPKRMPAKPSNGSLARLRHYLTLDEPETDDEGLDLLLEVAEP